MELDCFDWAQLELLESGQTEPGTINLISRILGEGDTFVDVGANVGFTSLIGRKRVGEVGKVIAFEPQPYCCERILRNWEINSFDNLSLHVCAVGEINDLIELTQQPRSDKSKLSLTYKNASQLKLVFTVPICTLDSVLEESAPKRIKLLKIDVEGYEASVLRGALKTLSRVDHLVFEALTHDKAACSHVNLCASMLGKEGFDVFDVLGNTWKPGDRIAENNLWAKRPC